MVYCYSSPSQHHDCPWPKFFERRLLHSQPIVSRASSSFHLWRTSKKVLEAPEFKSSKNLLQDSSPSQQQQQQELQENKNNQSNPPLNGKHCNRHTHSSGMWREERLFKDLVMILDARVFTSRIIHPLHWVFGLESWWLVGGGMMVLTDEEEDRMTNRVLGCTAIWGGHYQYL